MRQVFRWLTVALCCVAGGAAGGDRQEARLQAAIAQAEQALARQEAALGKEHLAVAEALEKLGELYEAQGIYPGDKPFLPGPFPGKNLRAISQHFYHQEIRLQGRSARATPLYARALAIREAAQGENHPDAARLLHRLAGLYRHHGVYGLAELFYVRAINRREDALGSAHLSVAESLHGLASVYEAQGFFEGAEVLHQRALAIREAALGKSHTDVASSLHQLGNVALGQGKYTQAESLFNRALAMAEAGRGKNLSQVAEVLDSLGVLFMLQGMYARAEPLSSRALALQEATLGKAHPKVATVLAHRALLLAYQEHAAPAEKLLQRALAIQEAALGENHPRVAATLRDLARLRLLQQRHGEALPLLARAFSISEARLRVDSPGFSESQLASVLRQLRGEEEQLYSLLRATPDDEATRRLALTAVLLRKGRSATELAAISRSGNDRLGTEMRATQEQLRQLRTQLAALSLQGPGELEPAEHQQRLRELTRQSSQLEWELARGTAFERLFQGLPPPGDVISRVTQGLPRDGALIEFITYTDSPLLPRPRAAEPQQPGQSHYLAMVLFPGGESRAVDLGPAEPIDRAASLLRDALARRDAGFQAHAQALYRLAFRPLLPLLGSTRRLFLAPDGQLGLVPFAALHDGRRFLFDFLDFTYLTSGRDLMPRLEEEWRPSSTVVVLADPDFSAKLPVPSAGPAGLSVRSTQAAASKLRAELAQQPWAPLPGTRQEAEAIQRLIPQARLFLGAEATKARLLEVAAPGVLHLATHGFFLDQAPAPETSRGVGNFGALGERVSTRPLAEPLLHSGLVLAGVSAQGPAASSAARGDSALVTALELTGLNLWGTQLVVLSACDTGRGVVTQGQGIYGLRRALVLAGAETVVMSLWKVNDDTTRQLMETYYRNLLEGQGRAMALSKAMGALRVSHPHPHFWAPFIVLGRDTPLSGLEPGPTEAARP